MEKTFCDYCKREVPETEAEVAAPEDYMDKEELTEACKTAGDPNWVPTLRVNLMAWDESESADCCLDCMIKVLTAAKAKMVIEALC